jgi:hypothetical protein
VLLQPATSGTGTPTTSTAFEPGRGGLLVGDHTVVWVLAALVVAHQFTWE